jgi:predicted PurR-regulated permease PerM
MPLSPLTRSGLLAVAALGIVILLRLGELFFIPVVIALLLASLLVPAVRWLNQRLQLPWSVACLAVIFGVLIVNLGITLGFALAVPRMLQDLPDLRTPQGQVQLYGMVREQVQRINPQMLDDEYWPIDAENSRIFKYVQATLSDNSYIAQALLHFVSYLNNWLWQWILILFILLFMLLEGETLTRRLPDVIGAGPEVRAKASAALAEMAFQVRNFIWWRTVLNIGLGVAVGLFYQYMGLRHAWVWALLTGILCYVPYLGPIAAGGPPVLEAFMTFEQPWKVLFVVIVYVVLITLEGYFFFPWLIGRGMELNATTVMLSCLFWELVWGLPGLFLAMPIMAAVRAICQQIPDLRPWANLMSITELEGSEQGSGPAEEKNAGEPGESMAGTGPDHAPPVPAGAGSAAASSRD